MKQYTDIFLDFDDTLYDTHGNADIALHEVFDIYNLAQHFPEPETFYTIYWQTNAEVWARYSRGEMTKDELIVERFMRPLSKGVNLNVTTDLCLEINKTFLELCSDKPGVIPGAHELVNYLRQRGYRLHICSNGFHEVQYRKLRACGMANMFDTVILSEDAGVNKPAQQFFDYALKMSGAKKETTIMIGDNPDTDIIGAINAGIDTIYFKPKPDYIAHKATYTANSLKEICEIL